MSSLANHIIGLGSFWLLFQICLVVMFLTSQRHIFQDKPVLPPLRHLGMDCPSNKVVMLNVVFVSVMLVFCGLDQGSIFLIWI